MKLYEVLYIVFPEVEANLSKITAEVSETIKKFGGEIVQEEIWGQRRLAYPIKKKESGIYVLLYFKVLPSHILKIESFFHLHHEIMRYLTLSVDESALTAKPELVEKVTEPQKEAKIEAAKEALPEKKEIMPQKEEKKIKETKEEVKERQKLVDEKLKEILKG